MNDTDHTNLWGVVELMGHKVVAGRISKDEMLGKPMLRIDVPTTDRSGEFTQFYGEAAIYCVTFTSEEVARRTAAAIVAIPVCVYSPAQGPGNLLPTSPHMFPDSVIEEEE